MERAEQAFVDGLRPAQIALGVWVAAEPELDPAKLLQRVGGALGRSRQAIEGSAVARFRGLAPTLFRQDLR